MNVLFLQHGLGFGGATKSLILMQDALSSRIKMYTVSLPVPNLKAREIIKEFRHSESFTEISIPFIDSYSERTINQWCFYWAKNHSPKELIRIIKEKQVDILHVNSSLFSNILRHVKEELSCGIVVHMREMLPYGRDHQVDHYIIDNTIRYADAIIGITDNELRFFSDCQKTFVLPNPHPFKTTDVIIDSGSRNTGVLRIGMCANLKEIKGHLVFLKAAAIINDRLKESGLAFEFLIIGYPHASASLREQVKGVLNYGYKTRFDKMVLQLALPNLQILPFSLDIYHDIYALDIYVRPDLSAHPWGRDVIEAMALKKPVVATGSSGFYVQDGVTGCLTGEPNAETLARKIIALILDPDLRIKMGNAGYERVRELCDMDNYANKMMEIYNFVKKSRMDMAIDMKSRNLNG